MKVTLERKKSERRGYSGEMYSFGDSLEIVANVEPTDGWEYEWSFEGLQPISKEGNSCKVMSNNIQGGSGLVKLLATRNGVKVEAETTITIIVPDKTKVEVVWIKDEKKIYGDDSPKDNIRVKYIDSKNAEAYTTNFDCSSSDSDVIKSMEIDGDFYDCREWHIKLGEKEVGKVLTRIRKVENQEIVSMEEETNEN